MITALIMAFLLGYVAIALEHPLKLDKAASALFTAAVPVEKQTARLERK
jgi:hypothetical protein